jgi:ribokinase
MGDGIVVVGSLNVDYVSTLPRLPLPGETISGPVDGFEMNFGGKGGNACCMAALLHPVRSSVSMVACSGRDAHGDEYQASLESMGVNTMHIKRDPKVNTGVATIFVGKADGENMIGLNAGANALLTVADVQSAGLADVWAGAGTLLCQNEIPPEVTLAALAHAKSLGVTAVFNPAPFTDGLEQHLRQSDVVIVNETELVQLGAMTPYAGDAATLLAAPSDDGEEAGCTPMTMPKVFEHFGVGTAIVTCGSHGLRLFRRGCAPVSCSAIQFGEAVDSTGAGDAFCGAFAALKTCHPKVDLARVVLAAGMVASISVTKAGAQKSYPSWEDVQRFCALQPEVATAFSAMMQDREHD